MENCLLKSLRVNKNIKFAQLTGALPHNPHNIPSIFQDYFFLTLMPAYCTAEPIHDRKYDTYTHIDYRQGVYVLKNP